MTFKKRFSISVLLLCLILALQGCAATKGGIFGSGGKSDSAVSSASVASTASKAAAGDSQLIDADTYSLEIPSTWTKTKYSGVDLFLPQDADITAGASNINIVISAFTGKAPSLADYKASFPAEFEKQIKSAFPDATNFQYSNIKVGGKDVFVAKCDSTATLSQTQYYPINNKAVAVLTVTDIGDGDKMGLQDIAKHMLETLVIK